MQRAGERGSVGECEWGRDEGGREGRREGVHEGGVRGRVCEYVSDRMERGKQEFWTNR